MLSITPSTPLADVLANQQTVRLLIGREAATELGLATLEYLETSPVSDEQLGNLASFAARHDENSPARDAIVVILLNASGTLAASLAARARAALMKADWGSGREAAGLSGAPEVNAVPRRQALGERLLAERARRIRPRMHAVVAQILDVGDKADAIPSWFLARNWIDLRDALTQRVRSDPTHRVQIAQWLQSRPAEVRAQFAPTEEALIDVATQAILHNPETAPLAPYVAADVVAERVRRATAFRGAPARTRLGSYLARLAPNTPWCDTIREMVAQ